MIEPQVEVLDTPVCTLGEGPVWSADDRTLYWIEIRGALLHRWSLDTGLGPTVTLPSTPGCLALGDPGELILGLATGIARWRIADGTLTPLVDPEADREGGRFNDGAPDPVGRLWIGSIESGPDARDGTLYLVEPDLTWTPRRSGLAVPNGIDYSPDGRTLYVTITETRTILAFDYDPDTGATTHERVFAVDVDCWPDGLCVDRDGYVWSAKWDGGRITRYSPDGRIDREIPLPVANATSLAFGGDELDLLFVTTAIDEPGARVSPDPDAAGRLCVVRGTGATGRPLARALPRAVGA